MKDTIYNWEHMRTYVKATAKSLGLTDTMKAVDYAVKAHEGQTRKRSDVPYIYHPIAVAGLVRDAGYDQRYQTVAVLHDVLEDTETDEEELVVFGEDILEAVKLLTRPEGADEAKYVAKILQNPIARVVKNADKICNLWDAMYEGTPGEKRTKKVRSFAEKYIKKSEDFYKGRFSKALDDSIERAHILLSEDIVSERQYPSYSREEMTF